jgi:hypothetical protein
MVTGALGLGQTLAVRVRPGETAEIAAFAKPLLVTKKRVTDLLPPIGIDDGAPAAGAFVPARCASVL